MISISKRLDQIVRKELSKSLIPIKTSDGIIVGDLKITSQQNLKFISRNNKILYGEIHLNSVAIQIANYLALRKSLSVVEKFYAADQIYGRWYTDSQILQSQYQKARAIQDFNRADVLFARYCESRDKMLKAKEHVESLLRMV